MEVKEILYTSNLPSQKVRIDDLTAISSYFLNSIKAGNLSFSEGFTIQIILHDFVSYLPSKAPFLVFKLPNSEKYILHFISLLKPHVILINEYRMLGNFQEVDVQEIDLAIPRLVRENITKSIDDFNKIVYQNLMVRETGIETIIRQLTYLKDQYGDLALYELIGDRSILDHANEALLHEIIDWFETNVTPASSLVDANRGRKRSRNSKEYKAVQSNSKRAKEKENELDRTHFSLRSLSNIKESKLEPVIQYLLSLWHEDKLNLNECDVNVTLLVDYVFAPTLLARNGSKVSVKNFKILAAFIGISKEQNNLNVAFQHKRNNLFLILNNWNLYLPEKSYQQLTLQKRLVLAVALNQPLEFIKFLSAYFPDSQRYITNLEDSPLGVATVLNNQTLIEELVNLGMQLDIFMNHASKNGGVYRVNLHYLAAYYGHIDLLDYLVNKLRSGLSYAISSAIQHGKLKPIKLLVLRASRSEIKVALRIVPVSAWQFVITRAVNNNETNFVRDLLDISVRSINEIAISRVVASRLYWLHRAAKKGHTEILNILIGHKAVDQTDNNGKTALEYAVSKGHLDVVKVLLQTIYFNRNNAKDLALKSRVLLIAIMKKYINIALYLLRSGFLLVTDDQVKLTSHSIEVAKDDQSETMKSLVQEILDYMNKDLNKHENLEYFNQLFNDLNELTPTLETDFSAKKESNFISSSMTFFKGDSDNLKQPNSIVIDNHSSISLDLNASIDSITKNM